MKRTMTAMLLILALTGCRLLEQQRHEAASAVAATIVRTLFELQSSAPAGPPSRPLDRPVAPLAMSPAVAAAAVVDVVAPVATPQAIAAVEPPPLPAPSNLYLKVCLKPAEKTEFRRHYRMLVQSLVLCRARRAVRLDENGNASL